ncbi:XRE family transcriptional regulator [Streptomyces sp. WAC 06783]|uniref:helix-turn-helix domain-containing protein n=1 Tax=Streptomyces sp. WAC 06783 TaxID=2203211 RepID=UPI000F747A15|nr:helix-turn-helix transcriptional regulator [Streptomyces sp. WAC 06783]RSO09256.1 XRE family transcriptional regulator [Streptomyces sp. WAC 06783]
MDTQGIGRRIAYWRSRRRMTQEHFAALMGQSVRWVEDLEGGRRQRDPRLSVIERAADALGIDLTLLLSDNVTGRAGCVDATEITGIRRALQRHDIITGTCAPGAVDPPPLTVLRSAVRYAHTAFQAGHFASLGRLVPELLADTTRAAARHHGDDQLAVVALLAQTLTLTEASAIKFGDTDLALIAGHRAVAAAERCGDPVIRAAAARHLADAMTHHGQPAAGAAFALAAADRLAPDLTGRGPDGWSVLGMLYLKATMAQAQVGRSDDRQAAAAAAAVPALLHEADEHATRLGIDANRMFTAFGPTNVAVHRVAAHVALADGMAAVTAAAAIPVPARDALTRERRAHHFADLALGCVQAGRREDAVDALLDAEEQAPEEVRCRPRTRRLVDDLRLLGAGSAQGRLRALADRCGLPR